MSLTLWPLCTTLLQCSIGISQIYISFCFWLHCDCTAVDTHTWITIISNQNQPHQVELVLLLVMTWEPQSCWRLLSISTESSLFIHKAKCYYVWCGRVKTNQKWSKKIFVDLLILHGVIYCWRIHLWHHQFVVLYCIHE